MKKISMVVAVLAGAIMLCAGSAGATVDYWWWEIKITGKGVQLSADDATQVGVVYEEGKDKIRETVYAIQDPATLEMYIAFSQGEGWGAEYVWLDDYTSFPTDKSIVMPWWCPNLGPQVGGNFPYYFCSHARIQLKKNKAGDVTPGRLTTLGSIYENSPEINTSPFKAQAGGVTVRGKTIDEGKVPAGARDVLLDAITRS